MSFETSVLYVLTQKFSATYKIIIPLNGHISTLFKRLLDKAEYFARPGDNNL